ncbi:MAG TPA: sensor domain-containing diguanylate cyclase [Rugosimonospora sp.]|nr:sensor domain-containing diguanylate cyclase [Rugosimonospora sp.]
MRSRGARRAPEVEEPAPTAAHGRLVTLGVWVVLALCVAAAVLAAAGWRAAARAQGTREFDATAADVASSMASALRRDTDFVATLRATVEGRPDMNNAQFAAWVNRVGATTRYPGGYGYVFAEQVPASGLAAFRAQVLADPPPANISAPVFELVPSGSRASYCLIRLGFSASTAPSTVPLGYDMCATAGIPGVIFTSSGPPMRTAADTGAFTVQRLDALHGIFGIVAPVYAGGRTPATTATRRAALVGWAVGTFDGAAILTGGSGAHPNLRIEIMHQNPGEAQVVLATQGTARTGNHMLVVPVTADGRWTVRVSGPAGAGGLSADEQGAIVLLTGLAFAGLLSGFVQVLARSRRRALRLVARRTQQLRHQATHDTLTGLPNRALILDRVEHALARARRNGTPLALMFLDLDGFKAVNDTYGHGVGDRLLRHVAGRLSSTLRGSDTIGRLGGDEFVVLVEGASLTDGPEVIAERIDTALAEPFQIDGVEPPLTIHTRASIGVAAGIRASAEELLRDADIALYGAKDAGKGRYVLFEARVPDVAEGTESPR